MGRMAQTWKPWPLGPSPLALGLELEPAGGGADARQRQHRATARASDATIVPSLEASTSALSRNFSIGNRPSGSFLPVHTLFTHDQSNIPGEPSIIPSPGTVVFHFRKR